MRPGSLFFRPVPVAAICVVAINDQVLKYRLSGFLTGKLSDAAGMYAAPLLALAIAELMLAAMGSPKWPTTTWRATVTVCVACLGLVLVKSTSIGADGYGLVLGYIRWPVVSLLHQPFRKVSVVRDPSDLVALPFALLACLSIRTRFLSRPRPISFRLGTVARSTECV